jgi:hypothetical protein
MHSLPQGAQPAPQVVLASSSGSKQYACLDVLCRAFATAGAMTGAWYLATGQSLSLSEQQIVDCR